MCVVGLVVGATLQGCYSSARYRYMGPRDHYRRPVRARVAAQMTYGPYFPYGYPGSYWGPWGYTYPGYFGSGYWGWSGTRYMWVTSPRGYYPYRGWSRSRGAGAVRGTGAVRQWRSGSGPGSAPPGFRDRGSRRMQTPRGMRTPRRSSPPGFRSARPRRSPGSSWNRRSAPGFRRAPPMRSGPSRQGARRSVRGR